MCLQNHGIPEQSSQWLGRATYLDLMNSRSSSGSAQTLSCTSLKVSFLASHVMHIKSKYCQNVASFQSQSIKMLIVSVSTQCRNDQGEYAKFVMQKTFWKLSCMQQMLRVLQYVQCNPSDKKIMCLPYPYRVKRRFSLCCHHQFRYGNYFDGYLYSSRVRVISRHSRASLMILEYPQGQ